MRVHLTEPGAPVEPGGEGVASVTVVNTSPVVRAYRLDLVGTTGWGFVDPRELRLFPEQAGDALVHFRPPKSAEVTSGSHPFAVKVTATDEEGLSVVEEGTVNVAPFCAAELAVRPKTARGSRKAKYRLFVTNSGNTRQRFDLSAGDEDEMLELKLRNDELALDPGESQTVPMVARTYGRVTRGERLPFTATVQGPGLTPTSATGALAIAPALGPWLVRAAIALFALALVVGGFMLTRNTDPKSTAGNAAVKETTTSLQPGVPTPTTLAPGDPGTTLAPAQPGDPVTAPPGGGSGGPATTPPSGGGPVGTPPGGGGGGSSNNQGGPAPTPATVATTVPTTLPPTTTTTLPPPPAPLYARSGAAINMTAPNPAGSLWGPYRVNTVTIPPGNWTIVSKVTAVNFTQTGDFVRCQLVNITDNKALDGSTDWVVWTSFTRVVQNFAQLTTTKSVVIDQRCGHDGTAGNGSYLDPGATLVAFAAQLPTDMVSGKSGANIGNIGGNAKIASISVGAGTWLVGFKANAVNFGAGFADVTCSTDVAPAASATVTPGPNAAVHSMSGFTNISGPTTVNLNCQGISPSYIDASSGLWAYRVTGATRTAGACGVTGAPTTQLLVLVHGPCANPSGDVKKNPNGAVANLGAGTWLWLGSETQTANATDIARCGSSGDNWVSGGATTASGGRGNNGLAALLTGPVQAIVKCGADSQSSASSGTHIYLKLK